jgi:hypothetical protein
MSVFDYNGGMQTTAAFEPERPLGQPPANVKLRSWPLRDGGRKEWLFVAVLVILVLAISAGSQHGYLALLGLISLAIALWRMWLPVRYEFGPKGIIQEIFVRRRRIPWSAIRQAQVRSGGILLLSDPDGSLLSRLRGVYIPWGEQQAAVLAATKYYLGPRMSDADEKKLRDNA